MVGVLLIGVKGAVATTVLAAAAAAKAGIDTPLALPSQCDPAFSGIKFPELTQMVFGGFDIVTESYSAAAAGHGAVPAAILDSIKEPLDEMSFYPVGPIDDDQTIRGLSDAKPMTRAKLAETVMHSIDAFKVQWGLSRVIVVDVSSTEAGVPPHQSHEGLLAFEQALAENSSSLSASMVYAYAAIKKGCAVVNFTPSPSFDIPVLRALALDCGVALAGKDGKTGQTLYKTVVAPMLRQRALKLEGWYSTNILGNRDGAVLHDPAHRATKIDSKLSVLEQMLGYSDFEHQVHIHYYPPRGDAKEAWDNIDVSGWFGVPMQIKINWLGVDSILAAPLVVDLVRWMVYFQNAGEAGVVASLSSYFKSPVGTTKNALFEQVAMLHQKVNDLEKR
jgi:myo-inositol-1-phosphate synthase